MRVVVTVFEQIVQVAWAIGWDATRLRKRLDACVVSDASQERECAITAWRAGGVELVDYAGAVGVLLLDPDVDVATHNIIW